MKGYVSPIGAMNFGSLTQVARELGRVKIAPAHYSRLLIDAYLASPTKARMVSRGLLANAKDFTERNQLLTATRLNENAGLRLEVVKAFRQSKRQMELITGLSLMTTKDATHFFRDYFEVGGTTREVTDWLAGMAELYVIKKKEHQVNPEYDGFWSDAWDVVVGAGKTIGEAISSVIDALNNLKITLVEVIDNILSYSQRTINNMIEALVGIGKEVAEIIKATIEAIRGSMEEALQKIFKGILAAGKTVYDIIKALYEEITGYISLGITTLVKIGRRIKHILAAAAELSLDILKDVIGILVDLGKSVWYILNWARKFSEELLTAVFEKLLAIGKTLGDLVAWCVRRSFDIMVKGFKILLALGYAVGVIVVTLITDPDNTYSKGLNALMELGGTVYDFFEAAADLGTDFVQRVYLSLQELGLELIDILKLAAEKGYEAFIQIVIWLFSIGVKAFNIMIWAIQTSVEVFAWVLEACDAAFETLADIVEWVASFGGDWMQELAHWLVEKARDAIDWLKDKVILPLLSVGKMVLVVTLALSNIVFLALAFVILKSLVNISKTDYQNWPASLDLFTTQYGARIATLHDVDTAHKYVVISDIHKESQDDIDGGIGHFYKNKQLLSRLLDHYAQDQAWTIVSLGDAEEFWYTNDLDTETDPLIKVQPIIDNNQEVYQRFSDDYYKNRLPRQFVKIRGNHDDIWREIAAVNKLEANGFPDLHIYDYGLLYRNGKPILLMHGHQFDPYNCDANNYFGKFVSNFIGEPLDQFNETLVSLFGEDARIEGWPLAPFFTREKWVAELDKVAQLDKGILFDESLIITAMRREGYACSMIAGHTHSPRIVTDSEDTSRFYINSGTCGWWEGCVWTIEITPEDIALKGWTEERADEAAYTYLLSEATSY